MSRPILGVLSPLTPVGAWKEFLWPLPLPPDADMQPLSVALPRLSDTAETSPLMAAMLISVLSFLPQRQFPRGALKG